MLLMRQLVKSWVLSAIKELDLASDSDLTLPEVIVENTKDESHGDFATNFALVAAKIFKVNPRMLATDLVNILKNNELIEKVEVAGPGFINFFILPKAFYQIIHDINSYGTNYGKSEIGAGYKVHLEFVSSNPTGPLHVGHGRHAAYGSCVANLLEHVGYDVYREYYVNDAGRQMQILALSVWLRYLEFNHLESYFPNKAYQGEYVKSIAHELYKQHGNKFCAKGVPTDLKSLVATTGFADDEETGDQFIDQYIVIVKQLIGELEFKVCLDLANTSVLSDIKEDLAEFGVYYDNWFSEAQMIAEGAIEKTVKELELRNYLYVKDDAIWFKTSEFGDEKDRVLIRANGNHTYFAPDIAYHLNKLDRGFDLIIDILGSDHHGYIPRLRACLKAFDRGEDRFITKLVQFVHLYRGDKQVQMSTRSGSFITLRELRQEVGNDAARFFYVMRKVDQLVDFDIELAKSQSQENPVYYVQYAHARICSIMRQLADKGYQFDEARVEGSLDKLIEPLELALLKQLSKYCEYIEAAAIAYEPHRIVQYVRDLAALFHKYYNAHAILVDEDIIRNARLSLILAVKRIINNSLTLLGVSCPEQM